MHSSIDELLDIVEELCGETPDYDFDGVTHTIETTCAWLTFTFSDHDFEIRSIEATEKGFGRKFVEAVHQYADEVGVGVVASNVRSTAHGFWQKMGYEEGADPREWYRVQ